MPLLSLPDECFMYVLAFLDKQSLYKCLFVNRHFCKYSIPIIWRDPFVLPQMKPKVSLVINTLLACLNEEEISSLVPCVVNLNNQPPLFDYGKLVRKIKHGYCVENVITWLKSSNQKIFDKGSDDVTKYQYSIVQKLVIVIYHMIMRQGSNLQEFSFRLTPFGCYSVLPKFSDFITYKPGIKNLRSLYLDIGLKSISDNMEYQDVVEFLGMIPKYCNGIVLFHLWIFRVFPESILDIIKLQPLENLLLSVRNVEEKYIKKFIQALECRSGTLKELSVEYIDFQGIDLSFIADFEHLKVLEFENCCGFTSKHYETLSRKKFQLKELKLWYEVDDIKPDTMKSMIYSLCDESLRKLSLNIVNPETIKAIKESCPNITFLCFEVDSEKFLDSTIPSICKLSSLKTLDVQVAEGDEVIAAHVVILLADHMTTVEYLSWNFYIDLRSFEYFTTNCRANLKMWNVIVNLPLRKYYLMCVGNYQHVHKSLKVFGINEAYKHGIGWTNEELEILHPLQNLGIRFFICYW